MITPFIITIRFDNQFDCCQTISVLHKQDVIGRSSNNKLQFGEF